MIQDKCTKNIYMYDDIYIYNFVSILICFTLLLCLCNEIFNIDNIIYWYLNDGYRPSKAIYTKETSGHKFINYVHRSSKSQKNFEEL